MKDIKCKCSHLRSEHKGFFGHCTVCQCTDYLRFDRPRKLEKYYSLMMMGMIFLIPIALISAYYDIEKLKTEYLVISAADHYHMLWIFLVGFMTIGAVLFSQTIIKSYEEKYRKNWN